MAWGRNELKELSKDKARTEREYKKKYAGPLPEDVVRRLGQSFFDEMTEDLRGKVTRQDFYQGDHLFSSNYYCVRTYLFLECADLPEENATRFHSQDSPPYFPENDYLCVWGGEDGFTLYYKNIAHVDPVFRYAERLCRESGLKATYTCEKNRTYGKLQIGFSITLPCDRNGVVK